MKVTFKDGSFIKDETIIPLGEKERPFDRKRGAQRKFLGLAEPVYGKEKSEKVCTVVGSLESADVRSLMILLK